MSTTTSTSTESSSVESTSVTATSTAVESTTVSSKTTATENSSVETETSSSTETTPVSSSESVSFSASSSAPVKKSKLKVEDDDDDEESNAWCQLQKENKEEFGGLIQAFVAEFLGTFFLTFYGCGSAMVSDGNPIVYATGFAWVLIIGVCIFAGISGANFNPTVTLGLFLNCSISPIRAFFYVLFQIAGAICAAICLMLIFPNWEELGLGVAQPGEGVDDLNVFLMECIGGMTLSFVILMIVFTKNEAVKPLLPIAIGLTLGLIILIGGTITGGAFNPARELGPALITNIFTKHHLYWISPLIGAILSVPLFRFFDADFSS